MSKILIVYGSTTWNTQTVAEEIESCLSAEGHEVTIDSWSNVVPKNLFNFNFTFIWSSTWWDGDLQDDMVEFVDELANQKMTWVKCAVFACWMSSFPHFCWAGHKIRNALIESQATVVWEMFTIDWEIGDELENAKKWALEILNKS